jgi:hypothetical protein
MYGHSSVMPQPLSDHSPVSVGPHAFSRGQPFSPANHGIHSGRGGRRLTIDPVVIGRVVHEATGLDKEAFNRSMKMSNPTMGPNPNFKQWKKNFLTFMSLKAAYLIPHVAIRESGV